LLRDVGRAVGGSGTAGEQCGEGKDWKSSVQGATCLAE
jgi:hypothetical protein